MSEGEFIRFGSDPQGGPSGGVVFDDTGIHVHPCTKGGEHWHVFCARCDRRFGSTFRWFISAVQFGRRHVESKRHRS